MRSITLSDGRTFAVNDNKEGLFVRDMGGDDGALADLKHGDGCPYVVAFSCDDSLIAHAADEIRKTLEALPADQPHRYEMMEMCVRLINHLGNIELDMIASAWRPEDNE
jgi:hypothetical protein